MCVVSVINFIVDLVRGARHVFFVDSWDTLGESVFVLFMVAQGLLSLVHELLDQVLALNSLVVFEGKVHRLAMTVHLLVEHNMHQLMVKVVDLIDHQVRAKFLL